HHPDLGAGVEGEPDILQDDPVRRNHLGQPLHHVNELWTCHFLAFSRGRHQWKSTTPMVSAGVEDRPAKALSASVEGGGSGSTPADILPSGRRTFLLQTKERAGR